MTWTTLRLRKERERPARAGHPWLFSGAFEVIPEVTPGTPCRIEDSRGAFVALGYVNPQCSLAVRVLAWSETENIDELLDERIRQAVELRRGLYGDDTNAYRLIASEGDFLPGLIVDRYADVLVVQILTAGMEQLRDKITDSLQRHTVPRTIFERSDVPVRREENLPMRKGLLHGEPLPAELVVLEHGLHFVVDPDSGQKTGFYLDQKEHRRMVRERAAGRTVLNACAYTGSFSVAAFAGNAAAVTSVDSSEGALESCRRNLDLNGLPQGEIIAADLFKFLRNAVRNDKLYDLVVLDPPAFAKKRHLLDSARRGYKEVNLQVIRLLRPGGELFTFSCSQFLDADAFKKLVFEAAANAGVRMQLLRQLGHPADHPVSVSHLEGTYLKGLHLRRI